MTHHKSLDTTYTAVSDVKEFTSEEQALISAAEQVCDNAYAPYSNFHVGAALMLDDGRIVTGSNQENAAYPSGLCAERVAIFHASSQYPTQKIKAIAITARKADSDKFIAASPCGGCRQVILEFEEKQEENINVIFRNNGDWVKFEMAAHLLPLCFDKHNLE